MKTLQIDENEAKKLYKDVSDEFKTLLEDTFGKDFFKFDFKDIKTFEDAWLVLEKTGDPNEYLQGTDDEVAYKQLKLITEAINNGWVADWNDHCQEKHVLFLNGENYFVLRTTGVISLYTPMGIPPRFCFETAEKAEYAGRTFTDLYKRFIL